MKTSKLSPRKWEKIAVRMACVAQSEWHASESEGAKRTSERGLLLIVGVDSNLIVARVSVEKAEVVGSCQSVQDLVDER